PVPRPFLRGAAQVALWSVFNCGMGYAAFLAFRDGGGLQGRARPSLGLFAASLSFNWAWPPIFYHWNLFTLAMLDISLLCGSVVMLSQTYLPINDRASKLMTPCFLWALGTAVFNYYVWR
ncbi:unnamed protein product, partial [Ixodes hexagonus]